MGLDAAYNPATNRWSRLLAAPLSGRQQTAGVWTGSELIVVGGNNTDGEVFVDAAVYNAVTRCWRRLPPMDSGRIWHSAVCTSRQLLVWGGQTGRVTPRRLRRTGSRTTGPPIAGRRCPNRRCGAGPPRCGVDRQPDAHLGRHPGKAFRCRQAIR
jgi:hypothetical protein